jgi:hypothetical protein
MIHYMNTVLDIIPTMGQTNIIEVSYYFHGNDSTASLQNNCTSASEGQST